MQVPRPIARAAGFTLIELLIAIQMVAVIGAVAVPTLIDERQKRNEAGAVGSLRAIATAQAVFRDTDADGDGLRDYATLAELGETRLIDDALASGQKQGYKFELPSSPGDKGRFQEWTGTATPITYSSGILEFAVGEAGFIHVRICPPGYVIVPSRDGYVCICESSPQNPANSNAGPLLLSVEAVARLNALGGGTLLAEAKRADFSDAAVRGWLAKFDTDGSPGLTFEEVLSADLRALVRSDTRAGGGRTEEGGPDELDHLLRNYQAALRQVLALGASNEEAAPASDIHTMSGYPLAFLELAPTPVPTRGQSRPTR